VKLTVFGATGGVGREVLRQALAVGSHVTAVARNPAKLVGDVDAVQTDLADSESHTIAQAVRGADAVISAVGPTHRTDVGIAARAKTFADWSSSAPRRSEHIGPILRSTVRP